MYRPGPPRVKRGVFGAFTLQPAQLAAYDQQGRAFVEPGVRALRLPPADDAFEVVLAATRLDAFAFGDTAAASLGINVNATRWALLGSVALLTGAMVAVSGAIGFVGLILPHLVRGLSGPGHRRLLPLVAVCGALFLVVADTLARTILDPRELPVGIITAFIGVPVFIVLIKRKKSSAWS